MEISEIVQHTLGFIDAHITKELSLENLAARAGFSSGHFSRLFKQQTGLTVMSFVRLRRLMFAAWELGSKAKILDIALEYGFETHSGFSKAFRKHYGCSPETFRLHGQFSRPKPVLLCCGNNIFGGEYMNPRIEQHAGITLAGYVIQTTTEGDKNKRDIPVFWQEYAQNGKMQALHSMGFVQQHAEYGACFPLREDMRIFEYMIGVFCPNDAKLPAELEKRQIPAATYAIFSTPPSKMPEFTAAIQQTWMDIMNVWFPTSDYAFDEKGIDFEYYDERCMGEDGNICDIYIPVVKKPTNSKKV